MEQHLRHSIENIFSNVGQFDRYAIFDFYFGSDAFNNYGSTVYGTVLYTPSERLRLKSLTYSEEPGSNDGNILLDGALKDNEINHKLKTIGFQAKDVCNLSTIDLEPTSNQFDYDGIRYIPYTIPINFQSGSFDLEQMELLLFQQRLDAGLTLIPYEHQKYIALKYLFDETSVSIDDYKKYLIDPQTDKFYNDVTFTIFRYLHQNDKTDMDVKRTFNWALKNRRIERIAYICKHLGIAQKHIDEFKENNHEGYLELMKVVYGFEPAAITIWGWQYPVFWDFERFVHIYLRHYKSFFIASSSKGQGTNFQYEFRDIRRVIKNVLESTKDEIESKLKQGKPFNRYSEQGCYYNGDYYEFQVATDGRLMKFHPQDKP